MINARLCRLLLPKRARIKLHIARSSTSSTPQVRENVRRERKEIAGEQLRLLSEYKAKIMAENVPRIEKIQVEYKGRNLADDAIMLMNRGLSTPLNCAQHISKALADSIVLALVKKTNMETNELVVQEKQTIEEDPTSVEIAVPGTKEDRAWKAWDLHRPLEWDCELKLLSFSMPLAEKWQFDEVNNAYWRSCAMVLGAVAQEAFDDDLVVRVANFPDVPVEEGAFCCDVELDKSLLKSDGSSIWKVDETALISLTKVARHIILKNLKFERVEVDRETAAEMFQHNPFQLQRIEKFTQETDSKVPVYRLGEYAEVCGGPLVPNTSLMYQYVVTAAHQIKCKDTGTCLWRFQGLSLPKKLQVHHAVWAMLEKRARGFVNKNLPFEIFESQNAEGDNVPLYKYRSLENKTKKYNHATGQWLSDQWESSNEKLKVFTDSE